MHNLHDHADDDVFDDAQRVVAVVGRIDQDKGRMGGWVVLLRSREGSCAPIIMMHDVRIYRLANVRHTRIDRRRSKNASLRASARPACMRCVEAARLTRVETKIFLHSTGIYVLTGARKTIARVHARKRHSSAIRGSRRSTTFQCI